MSNSRPAIGIDFGTSNSAIACVGPQGGARLLPLEADATNIPTALFFDAESGSTHYGRDAVSLYLAGHEGRLMRSLKSLLGSSLMQEQTEINHRRVSFEQVVSMFLAELGSRARQAFGTGGDRAGDAFGSVVMGRPVHFVDDDIERDRHAEDTLRRAARAAGWGEVEFQFEPIAAAFDFEQRIDRETTALVVDIGGGTSDFTVVRLGPGRSQADDRSSDVLATAGIHIAGTDFDQRLSLDCVMPLLGLGHVGPSGREVPSRTFFDLSTWHLINWLYAPRAIRQAQDLRKDYTETRLHDRLMRVLAGRHGHRVANEVEQAKIGSSSSGGEAVRLDIEFAEAGLSALLEGPGLQHYLAPLLNKVVGCATECVRRANLSAGSLGAVYLTGGSSALRPFQEALRAAFPNVELVEGDLFGGVAAGLAYTAAARSQTQAGRR
ncbi:Heat-shock protein [Burkholderiales bacterium 8X]|nr:Heat-shock protein [Burkholderiales bacterium 8X]